jgi:ppGpp synthetase/RelA/SpoT-type nucleotidyltranferase
MAKKIKRYNTGGVVERYSNPLFVQGMQGGLSAFGESSTSSVFGKGGVVDYVPKDKGNYFFRRFDGAIGSFGWEYNKKYNEGILYPLDDFDLNFTKIVKLKNGEVLFRYETDRMMGRMRPLIKFNLDKGLVYFGSDTEDGMPNFESRGIKANYIALEEDYKKYAKGGEVEITNETIDRGGLGSVQDNILANGGTIDAFEVGDIVTHKKGREYGHGKIYKISAIGIYLEDKYGNKREQPFYFPNDFKKVKKLMGNGGNVDPHKFTQDSLLKKGGSSKSRVQILDDTKKFDASMYEGLLGDFDLDGLANVDDPNPIGVKNNESIEQVKFSKVFQDVLDVKEQKDDALKQFVDKLRKTTTTNEKIYGRTKTPYSILNKLVDKRLLHAKYGLMDLIGTTISFKNFRDLESYKRKVENGKLGRVIEFDDYYVNPNDGYRAYHFIIDFNGSPIELQLKTDRMKEINILSHDAYKHKVLNKPYMLYLTTLANNADNGDERASEEFLELMSRKDLVKKKLTLSSHK